MIPQEVSSNLGLVPCPPSKEGDSGTQGGQGGTERGTPAGQPETLNLKELANAALVRLGKRDALRDTRGTNPENRCPAPPQKRDPCGTPAGHPHRAPPSSAWGPEITALVEWFLKTPPPPEPFELHQGVTVLRPDRFWEYLESDIATGPGKARACTGAFQKDLRRLAQLFGGPATVGGR